MPTFGGRAIPGVTFSMGNSHQDLKAVTDDLKQLRAVLQSLKDDAKGTTDALNALGKTRPAPRTAPAPARAATADDQEYERVVAQRRQATRAEAVRRANDPVERQYAARTAAQRQQRMQQAVAPRTDTERRYQEIVARDREKAMEETVKRGTTNPEAGALGRLTNFAGWSPFMPGGNMMYMMQMALGDMGLGLPMAGVAAGMGAVGLGAGALAANAFAVNAQRTGQQTIAATGAPPFSPDTYVTGATEAQLLEQRAGQLHLTGPQSQQAVSALAAGGLTGSDAFGAALTQTATLVNAFGMSVSDAATFVTTMQVDMGRTTQQTADTIAAFGKVAQATGQPLAALGQVVEQTPNLLANLSGPGAAVAASVALAMAGSTPGAIALQGVANASGGQALSIAAQMGMSDQQFNALQSDPTGAGQKRIDDWTVGIIQQSLAQSGGATDQAMIVANARLGTSFDKATFTRLANLGPDVSSAAFSQALNAPTPPVTPGNLNSQVANQTPDVNSTANPWNIKDATMNAVNVFLTGALGQVGTTASLTTGSGQYSAADLTRIAKTGGVAGNEALAISASRGTPGALASLMNNIGSALFGPSDLRAGLGLPGGGASPAPGGGGSTGGAVQHQLAITVDVRQGGVSVGSTPAPINVAIQNGQPSQQYRAYVPTTGRGPQYP